MLSRHEVTDGYAEELEEFEALIRSLEPSSLDAPSRCTGWSVRDVASHVIGTLSRITAGRFHGITTPEVAAEIIVERQTLNAGQLAEELAVAAKQAGELMAAFDDAAWNRRAPGDLDMTVGRGMHVLWHDAYVHDLDIRDAIGRTPRRGKSLRGTIDYVATTLTERGWRAATLALDDIDEFTVSGGGSVITGDPVDFVLVATGRKPASDMGLDPSVNIYA